MVHANTGAGEEEGDPWHVDVGAGPSTALLQLPPVERPEDRLQEVDHWDFFFLNFCIIILSSNYKIFLSELSHPAAAGAGLSAGTTHDTAHA